MVVGTPAKRMDYSPAVGISPPYGTPIYQTGGAEVVPDSSEYIPSESEVADPLPGERIAEDEEDPQDRDISRVWVQNHVLGIAFLCMGTLCSSRYQPKYKNVAEAGWLRGWAWGSFVIGSVWIISSVILLAQWPDYPMGWALALMLLGIAMVLFSPVILHNGNIRLIRFQTAEANAIYKYPEGADVQIFDPHPDDPNEVDVCSGITGHVVGHLDGRVAVRFHHKHNREALQSVKQFVPKHKCMEADGLFLPCHLRRIRIKKPTDQRQIMGGSFV